MDLAGDPLHLWMDLVCTQPGYIGSLRPCNLIFRFFLGPLRSFNLAGPESQTGINGLGVKKYIGKR